MAMSLFTHLEILSIFNHRKSFIVYYYLFGIYLS